MIGQVNKVVSQGSLVCHFLYDFCQSVDSGARDLDLP